MRNGERIRVPLAMAFSCQRQWYMGEEARMTGERPCSFYRRGTDPHRGVCEFDCAHTDCAGEVPHCRKLDDLRQYVIKRNWMKAGKIVDK